MHERDRAGRLTATAYTPGDALPAGWLGGEPIEMARAYHGTDIA